MSNGTALKTCYPPERIGKKGRPRQKIRTMFNGMLRIARNGCQWRELTGYYSKCKERTPDSATYLYRVLSVCAFSVTMVSLLRAVRPFFPFYLISFEVSRYGAETSASFPPKQQGPARVHKLKRLELRKGWESAGHQPRGKSLFVIHLIRRTSQKSVRFRTP